MPAGPKQRARGFRGGPRGGSPGRGRGNRGRGVRGSGRGGYHTLDDMDQMYMLSEMNNRGVTSPRGRGSGFRGRFSNPGSGSNTPLRGRDSPRGRGSGLRGHFSNTNSGSNTPTRGRESPRGRGRGDLNDHWSPRRRGRGRGGSKLRPDAPLSGLLYQERPFLRPVIFVPSVFTKMLFQEEEEILQAVVETVGEEERSHAPTADRVMRIFSGGNIPRMSSSNSDDDDDELEEIDFNDMEKLLEQPDRPSSKMSIEVAVVEEKFTGFFIDTDSAHMASPSKTLSSFMAVDEPATPTPNQPDASTIIPHVVEHPPAIPSPLQVSEETVTTTYLGGQDPMVDLTTPTASAPDMDGSSKADQVTSTEGQLDFYFDTEPSKVESPHLTSPSNDVEMGDQEEIIVYVAPHPRSGKTTSTPSNYHSQITSGPSTSILTGTTNLSPTRPPTPPPKEPIASTSTSAPTPVPPAPPFESVTFSFGDSPLPKKQSRQIPVFTARSRSKAQLKLRKQEARAARKRAERQAMFGSFGAIMSEAQLHGKNPTRDPMWDERRRGDSDVDWGDEADSEGGGDTSATGLAEGMELDPDLEIDARALSSFARGMEGDGGRFMTMDDIADKEMMRMEDEEQNGRDAGSSGDDEEDETTGDEEVDAVVNVEEGLMIAESGDGFDLSDEDDSDDEGHSPRTSFQARLEKLRNRSRGKRPKDVRHEEDDSSDGDDDDAFLSNLTWAEEDEDFIAHIQTLLDENEGVVTGRDRKERNKLFRAVHNGDFDDLDGFSPARKPKDKYKDFPPELQAQWHKDREKKAEYKRARELARLEAAADPFSQKKGGKKGKKAMLAAAKLDPTITVIPNRIVDMVTLVQQIRRFIADVGGPSTMSLPPTNKQTRKNIHEMALAFNLKSQSKGKGDARYTTLGKTTRSGFGINEKKIAKIVRRNGGGDGEFMGSNNYRDRGQGKHTAPRHKDGDEVGKAAPKIGESNIGFKMLALMGWSEGDRIGVSGGLDAPLTAVMKNTKLGLGANK